VILIKHKIAMNRQMTARPGLVPGSAWSGVSSTRLERLDARLIEKRSKVSKDQESVQCRAVSGCGVVGRWQSGWFNLFPCTHVLELRCYAPGDPFGDPCVVCLLPSYPADGGVGGEGKGAPSALGFKDRWLQPFMHPNPLTYWCSALLLTSSHNQWNGGGSTGDNTICCGVGIGHDCVKIKYSTRVFDI
jgi:hypothetical protein